MGCLPEFVFSDKRCGWCRNEDNDCEVGCLGTMESQGVRRPCGDRLASSFSVMIESGRQLLGPSMNLPRA